MPVFALGPAAATAFWGAVGTGAAAGASIYGAKKQSGAAKDAARIESEELDKQLALERENEQRRREEFDRVEAEKKRQYDAEQAQMAAQYNAEQARREPYRQLSRAALTQLSSRLGLPAPVYSDAPALPSTGYTARTGEPVNTTLPVASLDPTTLTQLARRGIKVPMTEALAAPVIDYNTPLSSLSRRVA